MSREGGGTGKLTLDQALDDVETRFLYNLPESEISQADRLFFQIEQVNVAKLFLGCREMNNLQRHKI